MTYTKCLTNGDPNGSYELEAGEFSALLFLAWRFSRMPSCTVRVVLVDVPELSNESTESAFRAWAASAVPGCDGVEFAAAAERFRQVTDKAISFVCQFVGREVRISAASANETGGR